MDFFKLVCGLLVGVLLAVVLKGNNNSLWFYLSVAMCLMVLFYVVAKLGIVFDYLHGVIEEVGIEAGYFEILIKIVGISYLCEFASAICKESGFLAVGTQIENGGKLTMMIMSMPILMAIVETVRSIF